MSILAFVVLLVIGIGLLVFMLTKLDFHPVLALFLDSVFFGITLGFGPLKTMQMISSGFGGTMTGIATTIIFGAVLAMGIMDTGATTSIANFFIRLFKGKRLELAPASSSFLISIPVFADVTFVLAAPSRRPWRSGKSSA